MASEHAARPSSSRPVVSRALVVATAVVVGAVSAHRWPGLVVIAVVVYAGLCPRRVVLAGAAFVVAGTLGAAAIAGLDDPPVGAIEGTARLVGDPERRGAAVRVDVRLDGRRYELVAYGTAGGGLVGAELGDVVVVAGRVDPPRPGDESWFRPRHVVARLTATAVTDRRSPGGVFGVARSVRSALTEGADSMTEDQRALYLGLVVGDDRAQRNEVTERFRRAGLTHLLAVSGQNVAFLLAALGPLLRRLPMFTRFVVAILVIVVFVVITRAEPSVMRAASMAGLALASRVVGRPVASLDVVAWAVAALVVVDPLLVWSVGFQLSVLATLGIVVFQTPIERRLRGPGWFTLPLSVTLAAQLAVTPLLVTTFGGVSLSSVPANMLAGPAAGAVMVWGSTAGLAAGWLPAPLAGVIHLPTRLLLSWIDQVSRWADAWPLPDIG